jgi:probable metal-binding protein
MSTIESIHGHDVINMIIDSGRRWGREELLSAISERFGSDAIFHTCSATEMNAKGLVEFLGAKGKFLENDEGLAMDVTKLCSHG